ncbi:MFS general substrate transporter [Acephala macrosclerotiorum]|nr:MFS general substrate transporter [Acephala macrosclerotiorum]
MNTTLNTNEFNVERHEEQDLESGPTCPPQDIPTDIHDKNTQDKKKQWVRHSLDSPRNWSTFRKWWVISGLTFYTFIVFIVSTGFVTDQVEDQFGPMFLVPLSEICGRQPIFITSIFIFSILQIPTALSPNFTGLVVSRFITGCFAGLPISNMGASAADLFPTSQTAWPIMLFSFMSQAGGPDLGPTIGGAIYIATGSLKWLYWTL